MLLTQSISSSHPSNLSFCGWETANSQPHAVSIIHVIHTSAEIEGSGHGSVAEGLKMNFAFITSP